MFKIAQNKLKAIPSTVKKAAIGTALTVGTTSAFADVASSIDAAFNTANTNVGTVAVGVISLAAVVTGVSLIISFLKK
ncbi:MAG: hypothetical protein QX194_06065 [Methylococcales bacterium]